MLQIYNCVSCDTNDANMHSIVRLCSVKITNFTELHGDKQDEPYLFPPNIWMIKIAHRQTKGSSFTYIKSRLSYSGSKYIQKTLLHILCSVTIFLCFKKKLEIFNYEMTNITVQKLQLWNYHFNTIAKVCIPVSILHSKWFDQFMIWSGSSCSSHNVGTFIMVWYVPRTAPLYIFCYSRVS